MNLPLNPALHLMQHASQTCRELMAVMAQENAMLGRHQSAQLETLLQHKKRLTIRLEQILSELKKHGTSWKTDPISRNQAILLAEEIQHFQLMTKQNSLALQAAHQVRADIIVAVRDEMEASAPKAQLYSATGAYQNTYAQTRLVARHV